MWKEIVWSVFWVFVEISRNLIWELKVYALFVPLKYCRKFPIWKIEKIIGQKFLKQANKSTLFRKIPSSSTHNSGITFQHLICVIKILIKNSFDVFFSEIWYTVLLYFRKIKFLLNGFYYKLFWLISLKWDFWILNLARFKFLGEFWFFF